MLSDFIDPFLVIKVGIREWIFIRGSKQVHVSAFVFLKDKKIISIGESSVSGERVEIFGTNIENDMRYQLMGALFLYGLRKVSGILLIRPRVKIQGAFHLHDILDGKEKELLVSLVKEKGAREAIIEELPL